MAFSKRSGYYFRNIFGQCNDLDLNLYGFGMENGFILHTEVFSPRCAYFAIYGLQVCKKKLLTLNVRFNSYTFILSK